MNIERAIAGAIVVLSKDFKANNSELLDNFPQYVKKTDIGNDKTKARQTKKNFKAKNGSKPNSTIFLIRSNITQIMK